jgi:uncharacterized protein YkwD
MVSAVSVGRGGRVVLLVAMLGALLMLVAPAQAATVMQVSGTAFTTTAGAPFSGPVATFKTSDPTPTSLSAEIDWGDASLPSTGTLVDLGPDPDNASVTIFRVDGAHQYGAPGDYTTTIKVKFQDEPTVDAAGAATVRAAIQQPAATPLAATAGQPFAGGVATFTSPVSDPARFSATVAWGDGTPSSTGTIVPLGQDPGDPTLTRYRVDAEHVYGAAGSFTFDVGIQHLAAPPVIASGTASVAAPPAGPPATPSPAPAQPAAPIGPPVILGTQFTPAPRVGRRTVLRIRASAPDAPVSGYVVNLGETGARLGASACSLVRGFGTTAGDPFTGGTPRLYELSYTFRKAGKHTVKLSVMTGRCGREQRTASLTVTVRVGARPRAGRARAASAAAGRGHAAQTAPAACENDTLEPDGTNSDLVSAATVCLINVERKTAGVPAVAVDSRLAASARAHNSAMIDGRFFAHQGPSEPGLGERGKAAGYEAGMAENIGYGGGRLSTAKAMVQAWMDSPPHRSNMLDRDYVGVAVSVIDETPTGPRKPGASYTANFGTDDVKAPGATGTDPGTGTGTVGGTGTSPTGTTGALPAVRLLFAPTTFRATDAGPPTPAPATGGTSLKFVLVSPGDVAFTVRRKAAGRRVGTTCVKPRRANRRKRACTRTLVVGRFRVKGTEGANALRFSGRIAGRKLAPGSYVMEIVVTDAEGRRTKAGTSTFKIKR